MAAERERFEAEFVRLTAEWNAIGAWGVDGFVSASAWLAEHAHLTRPAAGRVLRSARHVRRFGATGDALASGAVTCEKVEALAEAARHREELYKRDEHVLLDIAARLSVRDLLIGVAHVAAAGRRRNRRRRREARIRARPLRHLSRSVGERSRRLPRPARLCDAREGARPDRAARSERRHCRYRGRRGCAAHAVATARRGAGEARGVLPRSPPGRQGQRHRKRHRKRHGSGTGNGTGSGESTTSASGRSTATVDALFTPQRHHLPFEHQRSEIVGFGPVPASTIARLACEARAGWAVLDERREVLDLGRRARTVSAAQRRAVVLRDEHCVHPGCRAPAGWCDVHHLVEWEHGGGTDLANLVLVCRRHHVAVHEGGKRLVRDAESGECRLERRPRGPSG